MILFQIRKFPTSDKQEGANGAILLRVCRNVQMVCFALVLLLLSFEAAGSTSSVDINAKSEDVNSESETPVLMNPEKHSTGEETIPHRWRLVLELEFSSPIIGAVSGGDQPFKTRAVAIRLGATKRWLSLMGFMERGHFEEPSYNADLSNDLMAFGVGAALSWFERRMQTMLLLGATVLMTDSFQNEQGTIGLYSALRPAGFILRLRDFQLTIYPITLSWIVPVMQNVPLFYIHFRTVISIGGTF